MGLIASLSGPFRLESRDHVDLTPVGSKERGLLLLLLTSPTGSRERVWLQAHLWSDRGKDQAASSLRQAVFQCRKALGPLQGLLVSEKLRISLDLSHITIVDEQDGELAEGLDVRDQEFETWLSIQRSARDTQRSQLPTTLPKQVGFVEANQAFKQSQPTLAIETVGLADPYSRWFIDVLGDLCARSLRHFIGADVARHGNSVAPASEFTLKLDGYSPDRARFCLRACLVRTLSGVEFWSGYQIVELKHLGPDTDPLVARLIAEIVEAVRASTSQTFPASREGPPALCARAIGTLFNMSEEGAREAEHLLLTADNQTPRACFSAWRAQVRLIQSVERYETDIETLKLESASLIARAIAQEPNNSTILALAANVSHYLDMDSRQSLDFAKRSVALNGANGMAWWSLGSALLYTGDARAAYFAAERSRDLFRGSSMSFFAESILGGAALSIGNQIAALEHFENSLFSNPNFRPALRYAIALNAILGREDRADGLATSLRALEQDFEPQMLFDDPTYPTSLLRRTGVIVPQFKKMISKLGV